MQSGKSNAALCKVMKHGYKKRVSNVQIKTVCIHFFQLVGPFPDLKILMDKTLIKVVTQANILGLLFDSTLSFKSHIQYLKTA